MDDIKYLIMSMYQNNVHNSTIIATIGEKSVGYC